VRASQPMFKGMELYSWRVSTDQHWCFALIPGTNRLKSSDEIKKDPSQTCSVDELNSRVSMLAVSESVVWLSSDAREFALPEKPVVNRIRSAASAAGITIQFAPMH
jgi:hypothetical protein